MDCLLWNLLSREEELGLGYLSIENTASKELLSAQLIVLSFPVTISVTLQKASSQRSQSPYISMAEGQVLMAP